MLVVLSAATITAVLVQVAVQAAGGQQRRLAYELAQEQASTIERRVANVLAQDPLSVFSEVLPDEVPRVCIGDEAVYPSAFGAGAEWPVSCGGVWGYEGTANLAKGARVFPPSPAQPNWRVEVFAEVGSERVGYTRTFLVGGRDRPMLYSGGALDLSALSLATSVSGPVYAAGDVTLGSSVLDAGVLVASESSVTDPGSAAVATPAGAGDGADLDVRDVVASPMPSSMLVSSLAELSRVACLDESPSLVTQEGASRSTSLCLTAGASLVDEAGVVKTFPSAGSYAAVLLVPETDARVRVFTRAAAPSSWPGVLAEWSELGVFPLPAHGLVVTEKTTVLGHCDELAGACRDWDGDTLPGSLLDASFTLLVGSSSSPADLHVGGPLLAGTGRVGAVVSGVVRFPTEATPAAAPLAVDLWLAVLGRPGSPSLASSGAGSRPALEWEGGVFLADFSVSLPGFVAASLTVPAEADATPPFFPAPGLLARSDFAQRLPAADLDALFVLGEASGMAVPAAPSLLDLDEGDSSMTLTWSAPTSDGNVAVSDYVVEYRAGGTTSWATFPETVSTGLTAVVSGLVNGVEYEFRVAAVNGVGQGPFSGTLSASPFVVPLAPTGLTVSAVPDLESRLDLTWNAVTNTAVSGYNVYRLNPVSGLFEIVASSATTSFSDSGLSAGTEYSYKVAAFTSAGEGVRSTAVVATTTELTPLDPVIASSTRGNLTVTLSFSVSATTARPVDGFRFYVDGVEVATSSDPSLTSYTFTGLMNGSASVFGVAAFNASGTSSVSTATVTAIATPNAPSNLVVVPEPGVPLSVELSWTLPSNVTPDGVYIYRLNDLSGVFEVVATVAGTSYFDGPLDAGLAYTYRVSAFLGELEGAASTSVSATAVDVPQPVLVLSSVRGDGTVTISFVDDPSDAHPVAGFRFYVDGVEVDDVPAPLTEYEFAGLVDGFTYEFGVAAYNTAGEGVADTVLVVVLTIPAQVSGLTASEVTGSYSTLGLAWDEIVTGVVDGYNVYRLNAVSDLYEVIGTTTSAAFTDTGRSPGTTYSYKVAAFNELAEGLLSLPVAGTTFISPAPALVNPTGASFDLVFCRRTADCSGLTGISAEFSYQFALSVASASDLGSYAITGLSVGSSSWTAGSTLAGLTFATPSSGVSIASGVLTATTTGTKLVTVTGVPANSTVVFRAVKVDASGIEISYRSFTDALGVYTSTGSSSFTAPAGEVSYLVVGGGGGGGSWAGGGGGGAGGVRSGSTTLTAGSYSISVGAGGAQVNNGGNSSAFGFTATGGGRGGGDGGGATSGGSGGGGGRWSGGGASGSSGQGSSGGSAASMNAGGGGGAGAAGGNGSGSAGGGGGAGSASTITGTSVVRAGGGGGGAHENSSSGGAGGSGGGGNANSGCSSASAGVSNTGGGGGGASGVTMHCGVDGAAGGSGIVVFRRLN